MNAIMQCIAPIFVPAHRPDRFSKAAASDADAIILDLEDGVPADAKDFARRALTIDFTQKPVIVRINGAGTRWHGDDVAAVKKLKPAAVMIPKTEDAELTIDIACNFPVLALIETAAGIANARALAATGAVQRLAFGSVDLAADLGCDHSREALTLARSELVLASRLGGLPQPLDGVTPDFTDPDLAGSDARHARAMGFGGKMVIHPVQLSAVLAAFRPSAEEVAWAQRVLDGGDGATAIDGVMVDEPVRIRARSILRKNEAFFSL